MCIEKTLIHNFMQKWWNSWDLEGLKVKNKSTKSDGSKKKGWIEVPKIYQIHLFLFFNIKLM